jgi:Cu+-exporting ATPase
MAASNAAARKGILIRDGVALEKAGKISVVMLDKTGTLTKGRPNVIKMVSFPDSNGGKPIRPEQIAASLARHSRHPISRAIAAVSTSQVPVEDWQEIRGFGSRGVVRPELDGRSEVMLGSLNWLGENGVDLSQSDQFQNEWTTRGATLVGLAVDSRLSCLFALSDTLKEGTREIVAELQENGLIPYLITGDNSATAQAVARETGIPAENVFAEVRPEAKAAMVSKLQAKGEKVAFVGDGINDAPALEQADFGIAVMHATDTARAAADMVLLNSDVHSIPESLELARRALRIIKQNLFWAFFYNALGVPLAALGFMSPVVCAGAMALSDLVVIGNALRLLRK